VFDRSSCTLSKIDTFFNLDQCQLMIHSIDTNLNTDNVVVLNPDGKLYLSLVKNTYETFGMEAMKRTKTDVKHDKHSRSFFFLIVCMYTNSILSCYD
jgi:hypothetical protein